MNKPQQDKNMADSNRLVSGGNGELVQGKEPLNGVKAQNAASSFIFLREISGEIITQNNQPPCSDLEHITKDNTICQKIIERSVAIMADPLKLVELGPALPMLSVLIQASREQDECQVSYSDIAKKCGVTTGTIKNWGKELEQRGYVQKINRGHCGLVFKIKDCKIGKVDIFSNIMKIQDNGIKVLDAVRLTMANAINSAITELHQGREAVL